MIFDEVYYRPETADILKEYRVKVAGQIQSRIILRFMEGRPAVLWDLELKPDLLLGRH